MSITTNRRASLTVPDKVRRRAGLKRGQKVEYRVSGGVISIVPKLPPADEEYTPAQRRAIDARLAAARKGPYYGPFGSLDEMLASMKRKRSRASRTERGAARR